MTHCAIKNSQAFFASDVTCAHDKSLEVFWRVPYIESPVPFGKINVPLQRGEKIRFFSHNLISFYRTYSHRSQLMVWGALTSGCTAAAPVLENWIALALLFLLCCIPVSLNYFSVNTLKQGPVIVLFTIILTSPY